MSQYMRKRHKNRSKQIVDAICIPKLIATLEKMVSDGSIDPYEKENYLEAARSLHSQIRYANSKFFKRNYGL